MKITFSKFLNLAGAGFFLLSPALSAAQTVPDSAQSGVIEKYLQEKPVISPQDFQQQRDIADEMEQMIDPLRALAAPVPGDSGDVIKVKAFLFEGNFVLNARDLQRATRHYLDTELTFGGLKAVAETVTRIYRSKGYFLARAYLPVQEIRDGQVRIAVVEGRLGKVTVEGAEHYTERFILSHFRPEVRGVLNYNRFLHSLLVLNEYSGLRVRAVVRRGQDPQTADLVLKVEDKNPLSIGFDANNYGSRYVSRSRFGSYAAHSNIIRQGDRIKIRGMAGSPARTLGFAGVDYSLPVNRYGTKAVLSYNWSDFNVQREFRILDSAGGSQFGSVKLVHPWQRSRRSSLDIFLGLDLKQSDNYLLGDTSSTDDILLLKTGVSGSYTDFVRGRNFYLATLNFGDNRSETAPSRIGSDGNFFSGQVEIGRFQDFLFGTYLYFNSSIQLSPDELPVPEQFAIGGAGTVRGYPQSEYLGDYGFAASLEWRVPPPFIAHHKAPYLNRKWKDFFQFVTFLDHGQIYTRQPQPGESKNEDISSAGFGIRFDLGNNFTAKVDVGFPIGGSDTSDGADSAVHFFLQKEFDFF